MGAEDFEDSRSNQLFKFCNSEVFNLRFGGTILGNTVVENAKITVIEISPDLPIAPLHRSWN
jgi:hypothetical protein